MVLTAGLCFILAAVLTAEHAREVWRTGAFFDTDDAARAVQLRAWLSGQTWYDLSIARLNPPDGVFMHWTRVVDVPLAALVSVAKVFLDPFQAERMARLVFPAACLFGLLLAAGWTAGVLAGARARVPAVILCFLGAPFLGQFVPGRIDHHAPQILLLMTMAGATLACFDAARARFAGLAGICAALSLAISLENLPFIALVAATFPIAFVVCGERASRATLWFAGAFGAALVLLFLATVGPAHRLEVACDALSIAHIAAGIAGCGVLIGLAALSPRLTSVGQRALAVAVGAPVPLAAVGFAAPQCLGDPFVGLDPLVRDIWLRHVAEVEPLPSYLRTNTWSAVSMVMPLACAVFIAVRGAFVGKGVARARYGLIAAILLLTLAMAFWGIRTLTSGLPMIAVAAAPWLLACVGRFATTPMSRVAAAGLAAVPFSPLLLAFLLPTDGADASEKGTLTCVTPEALAPLAALPRGAVIASIDMGSHLLAFTPHDVFGAPYHRDNVGNRLVLDALLAAPAYSEAIVKRSRADYVAICPNSAQVKLIAARAPDGLAARLLAGDTPTWLEPLALPSSQTVYRVTR